MSEKHTPGPLTVKTDGNGFFWVDKDTEDGGFSVCNTGDGVEAEANANLFAAAPALLEALKMWQKAVEDGGQMMATSMERAKLANEAIKLTNIAIELAEKESGK